MKDGPRPLKIRDLAFDSELENVPTMGQKVLMLFVSRMDSYDLDTLKLIQFTLENEIKRKEESDEKMALE